MKKKKIEREAQFAILEEDLRILRQNG